MPLNKAVFKTRTISALVFAVVMLTGLLWSPWSFLALFLVIHAGCWEEYLNLLEKIYATVFDRLLRLGFILNGTALMLACCGDAYRVAGYGIRENLVLPCLVSGFLLMAYSILRQRSGIQPVALGAAALGWVYLSLSWACMLLLRQRNMHGLLGDLGWVYPVLLVATIWINDTMAYITGSLMGKTPLSKYSPKKTWEGTIGGVVLSVALVSLAARWLLHAGWPEILTITATAAIAGTFGDLLESRIKRSAGVKDSGAMMPGHGGFLDRFDSMLLAIPPVWLMVLLLNA